MNLYFLEDLINQAALKIKSLFSYKISLQKRLDLYNIMESFLVDGIPALQMVESLQKYYLSIKDKKMAATMNQWRRDLLKAEGSLGEAMAFNIPANEASLIIAADNNGDIKAGFENAIFMTTTIRKIKGILIGQLIYPIILLIAAIVVQIGYYLKFVPMMFEIKKNFTAWPEISKISVTIADGVYHSTTVLIWLAAVYLIAFVVLAPRLTGTFRNKVLDKLPPYNLYKTLTAVSFLLNVYGYMQAGRNIEYSIPMLRKNANPWLRWHYDRMILNIRESVPYGEAIDTGLINPKQAAIIRAYGMVSSFPKGIERTSKNIINDTIAQVSGITAVLRIIGMALVGLSIVLLISGFYTLASSVHT